MGDLQWLRDDGPSQWFARATLAEYHYQSSGSFSPDTIDAVQTGRWLTLEARWQYRGWERHRVVLGGEVQRNFQQSQAVLIAGPAPTAYMTEGGNQRLGLFFNDEWTIADKLRLVLGARADRQLNRQHSVTPRLALWWQPIAELNVKLLDGRAYCEPNAYESQYGDGVSQIGNPALKSEHLRSTELAVDWRARPNLRMAASLYREKVEGLIDQQLQATTGLLQYQNIGRALGQGLELEADFVADGGWRLRGSVSRATTKVSDSGRQLANAPRALAKLHWSAPRPWAGAGGRYPRVRG